MLFKFRGCLQAGLDLLSDVLGHEGHFIEDLLLVTKAGISGLEFPVEPLELVEQARALDSPARLLPGAELLVGLAVQDADSFDQPAQDLEMAGPAGDELVDDGAVKPFLRRHSQELVRHGQVLFGGKPKAVNDPADIPFGSFDALANLHLLLARQ